MRWDAPSYSITSVDPNLRDAYVVNWKLGVQHALANGLSLEVNYVGNHGGQTAAFSRHQSAEYRHQQYAVWQQVPLARVHPLCFELCEFQLQQPAIDEDPAALARLSFIAGYTYVHGLDNGSLNRFGLIPPGQHDYRIRQQRLRYPFYVDQPRITSPACKRFGQVLDGWQINSIVNVQTAQPWRVSDSGI
jgi:hypothetical protein